MKVINKSTEKNMFQHQTLLSLLRNTSRGVRQTALSRCHLKSEYTF